MARRKRPGIAVAAACVALTVLTLGACSPPAAPPAPRPTIGPPAVKTPGVLRAGVDLSYAPFAGVAGERQAGLDVDVASALAGRLGLRLELVDVKASRIASAIADGDVDVAMSAPYDAGVLSRATIAGTYLTDGPALFARGGSRPETGTLSLAAFDRPQIGAQLSSEAYWRLADEFGAPNVVAYPTLREALAALGRGDVTYVGGDALVGAYIARDQPGVHYIGAIAPAHLLGVAVANDNTRLADAVRRSLDSLSADGVLGTIRASWVGELPKLPLTGDAPTTPAGAAAGP